MRQSVITSLKLTVFLEPSLAVALMVAVPAFFRRSLPSANWATAVLLLLQETYCSAPVSPVGYTRA